jgi:hypothetical protein
MFGDERQGAARLEHGALDVPERRKSLPVCRIFKLR